MSLNNINAPSNLSPEVSENVSEIQGEEVIEGNNIKISIVPSKRKRVKRVNIVVEGCFNISSVALVQEHCYKLTQQFEQLSFSFKNLEDFDLAALQFIGVLKTSPLFSQNSITVDSAELNSETKNLLTSAGLMELLLQKTNAQS